MKIKLSKINLSILLCSLLILISGIVLVFKNLNLKNQSQKNIDSYEILKDTNYKVLLQENNFYDNLILDENNYYLGKVIDKYLINFKYTLNAKPDNKIAYQYSITADLVGKVINNQDEKEIWRKSFVLKPINTIKYQNNKLKIIDNITIDYQFYNDLARLYEKSYGIMINAILEVNLNIYSNIKSNTNSQTFKLDDTIKISITIDTISEVKEEYDKNTTKEKTIVNDNLKSNNLIFLMGSFLIIIGLLSFLHIIYKELSTDEKKQKRLIKNIFRDYDDLIVKTQNEPKLTNLKTIKLAFLKDLIDVALQNNTNIIYYETSKNLKGKLYVIINDYVYIYNLNN